MIYLLVYLLTRNKALVIIFTGVVNHGVTPLLPMHIEWTHLPLVQDMTRYLCDSVIKAYFCTGRRSCAGTQHPNRGAWA